MSVKIDGRDLVREERAYSSGKAEPVVETNVADQATSCVKSRNKTTTILAHLPLFI
jgi:hypothetical protein